MNLNGGYAMIKYNATQEELAVAYKTKRPILLYDEDKRAHWAQINEKEVETIDEETEETIITYEYSYQLLNDIEALVDNSGNLRFIEGNGVLTEITGVTFAYNKWSLSGTHLMIVLAGTIANGTEIVISNILADYILPNYIFEKIHPIFGSIIDLKSIPLYADNYGSQNLTIQIRKETDRIRIQPTGTTNITANRSFRLQIDLLIDNE